MTNSFDAALAERNLPLLRRGRGRVLQLNLTKRCNLACHHCHVESSPKRKEAMDARTVARALELLAGSPELGVVDLTGGAPEMHPSFREIVAEARRLGRRVMDRCNLTILCEPGYGMPGSTLALDLVYNPVGPSLPPGQAGLEADYKRELASHYGISFHRLLTLTNMPIRRHAEWLVRRGEFERYQALLVNHFNPETLPGLMCRDTVSVDWRGELFDCDFNQALDLPAGGKRRTLWDVTRLDELEGDPIATGDHCFGCTAGAGSSCGGALVA